jgi:hypothetical protein
MTIGSQEHIGMMRAFESFIQKERGGRIDKEAREYWRIGQFYQDGHINQLFHAYSSGYAQARCVYLQPA